MNQERQIEQWVHKLNELGRQMDDLVCGTHPSTWEETLRLSGLRTQWSKVVSAEIIPEQLELFHVLTN